MLASQSSTITRAVELPIIDVEGVPWSRFTTACIEAWTESQALANWAARQLMLHDVSRTPDMERCPAMPTVYLYGLLNTEYPRRHLWDGATQAAQELLRGVQKVYKKLRRDIIWQGTISVPSFKFGYPYPLHNASWKASFGEDDRPQVSLTMPGLGRVNCVLRGGQEYRRQVALLRLLASGQAKQCAAALRARSTEGADGRVVCIRSAGGGRHFRYRALFKAVGHFPLGERPAQERCMLLVTDPSAFWVASVDERQVWILNGNHIANVERLRGWIEDADVTRQRRSEDLKYERRWPRRIRRRMVEAMARRAMHDQNRVKTFIDQAAAMAAGFAQRQHCGEVMYHDGKREFLPHFPWERLSSRLKVQLEQRQIRFTPLTGAIPGEVSDDSEGA